VDRSVCPGIAFLQTLSRSRGSWRAAFVLAPCWGPLRGFGWRETRPALSGSLWFSVSLTSASVPWAVGKGHHPGNRLGSLLPSGCRVPLPSPFVLCHLRGLSGPWAVSGLNGGLTFRASSGGRESWPPASSCVAFLFSVPALGMRCLSLSLGWRPGREYLGAGALTVLRFAGSAPEKHAGGSAWDRLAFRDPWPWDEGSPFLF
jgi:hypothetical protein